MTAEEERWITIVLSEGRRVSRNQQTEARRAASSARPKKTRRRKSRRDRQAGTDWSEYSRKT